MSPELVFLGWDSPFLPAVARSLLERTDRSNADLSGFLVIVPGRRAGRRLTELLIEQSQDTKGFYPPRIETLGRLPECLYRPKLPFADQSTQILAWIHALQSLNPDTGIRICSNWPQPGQFEAWRELAELLWKQHRELAADGLSFKDVAHRGQSLPGFPDTQRWLALAEVQRAYLDKLDALHLWDRQTARLYAIEHNECRTDAQVILAGTPDINRGLRRMLQQVAGQVTSLVFAGSDQAERFDELGCLIPQQWQHAVHHIQDDQIIVADNPRQQAEQLALSLNQLATDHSENDVTIGIANEAMVPTIRRTLDVLDVPTRWFQLRAISETAVYRLLTAVGDYLSSQRYESFAALVRHPQMTHWATRQVGGSEWLAQLDQYAVDHIPTRIGRSLAKSGQVPQLQSLTLAVQDLIQPALKQTAPLARWSEFWLQMLDALYAETEFDSHVEEDRVEWLALTSICRAWQQTDDLPADLQPTLTATEALHFVLRQVAGEAIPADEQPAAVEMLGWLELPLDDRPQLVVTGFNEGFVPKSINSDLLLPNAFRMHLGIDDNRHRYARDAYALETILHSRQGVRLICGRRDDANNPLRPSRLLLATAPQHVAERVNQLLGSQSAPSVSLLDHAPSSTGPLTIPLPERQPQPPERLSVTAFRDYLACPYRFYLKHILKLETVDDQLRELSPSAFGDLAHRVLEAFGDSPLVKSESADEIAEFLLDQLQQEARVQLGTTRLAAVEIQLHQLGQRLSDFAQWQAEQCQLGWRIEHVELKERVQPALLEFEDWKFQLSGRIDRIDYHPHEDRWRVIDYKTSDSGKPPQQTHLLRGSWVELQLPLYRYVVQPQHVPADADVELGYVVLPKSQSGVKFMSADWTAEQLAEADEVARRVGRAILNQEYWPPTTPPPTYDDFPAICSGEIPSDLEAETRTLQSSTADKGRLA